MFAAMNAHTPVPGYPELTLLRQSETSLVDQIVQALRQQIERQVLKPGARLLSVRQFATQYQVSTFTVVEAYERLINLGLTEARRGAGYFVKKRAVSDLNTPVREPAFDALSPDWYSGVSASLLAGSGWLPPEWYGADTLPDAVRQAMRIPAQRLRGYGHPAGFPALRQHLAQTLSQDLFTVSADQILLTHGATHAFDLILRCLCKPGDSVMIETPGYSNLMALVRAHGCQLIGIPRTADGLDLQALQRLAAEHKPRLMFVNTVLQNPIGTSLSQPQAHRLLALAEQHQFYLVEDDIYRELSVRNAPSLAALDGLQRVFRIGSYSKTLSPSLRVGSVCVPGDMMPVLLQMKMLSGLTTSEINERAVLHAIQSGQYRRMLERLRRHLDLAQQEVQEQFAALGLQLLAKPEGGMFLSAGLPDSGLDAREVADRARAEGILLAPATFFETGISNRCWWRFNVAHANDARLFQFLRKLLQ